MNLIQLLIVFSFNNFSFGSSFKSANVKRVPEDCSDLAFVKIDEIRTKCQNDSQMFFVIYGNYTMYVRVHGITRDHFPIARLEDQPKLFDATSEEHLKNCQILDDYVFDDLTYSLKNQSGVHFIGFNYLWLGCPQSLCLSASIDAATLLPNQTVYVFRGNYYWDLKFAPLSKKAHKITEWSKNNKIQDYDSDFDHGHFSAVVTNNNFTSFYRNDRQFIWELEKIVENSVLLRPSEFQFKMDAAFYVTNGSRGLTYDIRGPVFITDKTPFADNYIKSIGIPWDRVDAAFGQNETIYLFKDRYYVKLSENIPVPVKPKLVFKDLYKCPSTIYQQFGGYQAFLRKLGIEEQSDAKNGLNKSFVETKITKTKKSQEFESSLTIFIVISMLVIISIVIFIILRKKSKYFH